MIDPIDQELAASYALDQLDAPGRARFENAAAARPELRRLARDFQEVSVALALDCRPQKAPAETWNRIRAQLDWDRERLQSRQAVRRRTCWAVAGWSAAAGLAVSLAWSWWAPAPPSPAAGTADLLKTVASAPAPAPVGPSAAASAPRSDGGGADSETPAGMALPRADTSTNLLHAQLAAARAREKRWSEALAAALVQITNLASQLDAGGLPPVPGTRHTRWLGLAPPGQSHLADQAIDAMLSRLPSMLTNFSSVVRPPAPDANGVAPDPAPGPPRVPTDQLVEQRVTDADADPANPGEGNAPVGVAFWDGHSSTMVVAFAGVDPPPNGQQLAVWGTAGASLGSGGAALTFNSLGTLHSAHLGNGQLFVIPAPTPGGGSPAGMPHLFVTLEAVGSPLIAPIGPVVIRTP